MMSVCNICGIEISRNEHYVKKCGICGCLIHVNHLSNCQHEDSIYYTEPKINNIFCKVYERYTDEIEVCNLHKITHDNNECCVCESSEEIETEEY